MKLSPQSQGKQVPSYTNMRDAFRHHIQKSYGQGGQYVTKNPKYTKEIDMNAEYPTINISNKTAIDHTGYDIK